MSFSYRAFRVLFRLLYAVVFRWRVEHRERVPATGPVILAANHASFLDPPLICAANDRLVVSLARDTLFKNPVAGAILRSWHVVPVDRDGGGATGLRTIMERLKAGNAILLFPEGTRTRDGRLQPARAGLGLTIIKSDAPVVPVRLLGTYQAFGRHHKLPRPHQVCVLFGEPMRFAALREEARTAPKPRLKAVYQEVSDAVMGAIAGLAPEK